MTSTKECIAIFLTIFIMKKGLNISFVDVDILRAAEYNPRKHTEKQMQNLMESIRQY
jgi:hypothetical protein